MLTYGLVPENYLFTNPGRKWILFSHGVGPALLYIVGIVIVFQAWGFLVGMWQLQSKLAKEKRKSGMSLPFAIFVLPSMFIATFEPVEWAKNMHWYHWEFDPMWFWLSSLYFLLGWIITGIYMQMRKELQVSNSPWIWLVFLLTVVGYAMGFLQEDQASILTGLHLWTKRLMLGLGILIGINYGFMTWVRSDGMDMRRLLYLWNLRRIRDTLSEMPRWVFTTLLAWMSAIGVMIAHLVLGGGFLSSEGDPLNLYGLILAGMCFMTRDLAMILYFYFSSKPQRAVGTAILYWTVLYWLIPLLLGVVWMDDLNPFFLPDPKVHIAYAILPPLVEALVMCRFTLRRWRARFGEPVTAPPPAEPGPIPVNA
ncbi:MAG: hypothetical protein GWM98_24320 [Nitrospinaceae bacterium]|nr:hypothetical protein [Nitrospinaceae bacterium]